jgi:hypothetical protein
MMSAGECRAKALEAIANGAKETSAKARLEWEAMGRQWTDVAARIDAMDAVQRDLD